MSETAKREYKLAAEPFVTNYGGIRREIVEFAGGQRRVIANVPNDDAMDILDLIRGVYQDGREDNAAMLEAEGRLRTEPRRVYTHDADGAIIAVDARDNSPSALLPGLDHMPGDGRNMELLTAEEHAERHGGPS